MPMKVWIQVLIQNSVPNFEKKNRIGRCPKFDGDAKQTLEIRVEQGEAVRLYISSKQLECEDEINKEQTIFGNKVKYTIFSHSGSFLLVDFNLHIFRVLGIEFILDSRFT